MEALAARALGTRATAVRAFRRRLAPPADPVEGVPDPSAGAILLAAQVRSGGPRTVARARGRTQCCCLTFAGGCTSARRAVHSLGAAPAARARSAPWRQAGRAAGLPAHAPRRGRAGGRGRGAARGGHGPGGRGPRRGGVPRVLGRAGGAAPLPGARPRRACPSCLAAAARSEAGAPRGPAAPQDGAIAEAVVWESGPARRHLVADALLGYALPRHLPGAAVAGTAGLLDGALVQRGASADQLAAARRCGPRRPPPRSPLLRWGCFSSSAPEHTRSLSSHGLPGARRRRWRS